MEQVIYGMSLKQVKVTIVEDLARAGVFNPQDTERFMATLDTYDGPSLIRTMIHSHELREIRIAWEEHQKKSQKRRGRLLAKLTGQLRPDHVAKGYCLMEDEDFLYLYLPDDQMPPIVFNAMTTTMPDVIRTICRLEGQDD